MPQALIRSQKRPMKYMFITVPRVGRLLKSRPTPIIRSPTTCDAWPKVTGSRMARPWWRTDHASTPRRASTVIIMPKETIKRLNVKKAYL